MAIWQERESDYEGMLNRGALWAITYGDLMSYLAIFFLLVDLFTPKLLLSQTSNFFFLLLTFNFLTLFFEINLL